MYYIDAASDYLLYVEYLSTTNSLEVQLKMYTPGELEHRTSYFRLGNNVVLYVTQKAYAQNWLKKTDNESLFLVTDLIEYLETAN